MKYELIKEGDLFRIRALQDFGRIRAGDLGGLVSGPDNLSQEGLCWIEYGTLVVGHAQVRDYAQVLDHAQTYHYAQVRGLDLVVGHAQLVCGYAQVVGHAQLVDHAQVVGHAQLVYCYGQVPGDTVIR